MIRNFFSAVGTLLGKLSSTYFYVDNFRISLMAFIMIPVIIELAIFILWQIFKED